MVDYEVSLRDAFINVRRTYGRWDGSNDEVPDDKSIVNYLLQATKGNADPNALYALGNLYEVGKCSLLPKDVNKAFTLYKRAAEKQQISAIHAMGVIYQEGRCGISPNPKLAIKYYTEACSKGVPQSMMNLAHIYHFGMTGSNGQILAKPNIPQAIQWYEKAGKLGLNGLFKIYEDGGPDFPPNPLKASEIHIKLADSGDVDAMHIVGLKYYGGSNLHRNSDKGIDYLMKAAKKGHVRSKGVLGGIYGADEMLTKGALNIRRAIHYSLQAANEGDADAAYKLSTFYGHHLRSAEAIEALAAEVPLDMEKSIFYLKKASELGNDHATYNLACNYRTGYGSVISKHIPTAIQYLGKVIHLTTAKYQLATIYLDDDPNCDCQGTLFEANIPQALTYFHAAAEEGCVFSAFNIGAIYERGLHGVEVDSDKAFYYYKLGAEPKDVSFSHVAQFADFVMERTIWVIQQCIYHAGFIAFTKNRKEEARERFQLNIENGFYMAFFGLAVLAEDVRDTIKALTLGADHGIAEAWEILRNFYNESENARECLIQSWPEQKTAMLQIMSAKQSDSHLHITYSPHCPNCLICSEAQSLVLHTGETQRLKETPSSHIDASRLINIKKIGEGTYGVVTVATLLTSTDEKKPVALKRCKHTMNGTEMDLAGELYALHIMHGCSEIVQCYGHTLINRDLYVVMEYAPYGDLGSFLLSDTIEEYFETFNERTLALLIRWMYQIANGVDYMHRVSMQHCDIKPLNVLVFDGLNVKLTDLGLTRKAKLTYLSSSGGEPNAVNTCSQCCGTWAYMAPEMRKLEVNHPNNSTDIYSYGMTCVHLINRRLIDNEYRPWQNAQRVLSTFPHEVTTSLIELLDRCLSVTADQRPTASECVTQLKNMLDRLRFDETDIMKTLEA